MPKKSFPVTLSGEEKNLNVSWGGFWKNFTIKENDQTVGTIENGKELRKGKSFLLSDGTTISAKLISRGFIQELEILHENEPVKGSTTSPETRLKTAWITALFLSGGNLVIGIIGLFGVLSQYGYGIYNIILAPIYLGAALLIRRLSVVGLILAIVIFLGDAVLVVVNQIQHHWNTGSGWIVTRILIVTPFFIAFKPMAKLKMKSVSS